MTLLKWMRVSHKWTGIALALILMLLAVTGLLLLQKKNFGGLQPPTQRGAPGEPADFITIQQLLAIVLDQQHPDFRKLDDIDRVDFRPGDRVHKVRSRHHHTELQVDAVTGAILSNDSRISDLVESLHDGSWFARWVHDWLMMATAIGLFYLSVSGLVLWLNPLARRSRRSRRL